MADTTSPASSTAPPGPSSTATPAAGASPTSVPTTSPPASDPAAPSAAAVSPVIAPPAPKVRPEGVPESFWDKDKGELKVADWSKSYEELRQAKAEIDARKASIPAQADLYKPELPKELKLPAGMEVKTTDPLYLAVRQMAHQKGWTQDDFSQALGVYASIEATKQAALQEAIVKRDESLGANGPQRVEALKNFFKATAATPAIADQLANTLWTRDIIVWMEAVQKRLSGQGIIRFDGSGRETNETGERTDGRPSNWDKMSALDKRSWDLANANANANANRRAN
jgi:hypothetical protein